jgi:hypothetical protein
MISLSLISAWWSDCCFICCMTGAELKARIEQLETELRREQERYNDCVKSRCGYTTLRAIRDTMRAIKTELQSLYEQQNKE